MSKSVVQVYVEVTDEIREFTSKKGNQIRQQVVFIDTGSRYPEEATMFVDDKAGPLKPGRYVADKLRKEGYGFQLDLFSLKPVTAPTRAATGQ